MRQREEDRIGIRHLRLDDEPGRGEMGVRAADRVRVAAAGDEADELDERVTREDPDQLRTDVTRGADDRDPHATCPGRTPGRCRGARCGGSHLSA